MSCYLLHLTSQHLLFPSMFSSWYWPVKTLLNFSDHKKVSVSNCYGRTPYMSDDKSVCRLRVIKRKHLICLLKNESPNYLRICIVYGCTSVFKYKYWFQKRFRTLAYENLSFRMEIEKCSEFINLYSRGIGKMISKNLKLFPITDETIPQINGQFCHF